MSNIDSAGDQIEDIVKIKSLKLQRKNMLYYFQNFEIWGSHIEFEKRHLIERREAALKSINRLTSMSVIHIEEFQQLNSNYSEYTIKAMLHIIKILLYFESVKMTLIKKKVDSTIQDVENQNVCKY